MQEKLESVAAESAGAKTRWKRSKRTLRLAAGFALVASPILGAGSACLDRPIGAPPPVTTNIFVDRITQTAIDKIDLLFMIDNSISMSDKQAILRLAVPDLVNRLVNPICVDVNGNQFPPPAAGSDRCPPGQSREFNPINDINIAIVSSSLGDAGANEACDGATAPDSVDGAHLIGSNVTGTRVDRGRTPLSVVSDGQSLGFLQWRAGEATSTFNPATNDVGQLIQNFQQQVTAVGQVGCGWEASLESWFRFLIDPFPYAELQRVVCNPGDARTDCVRPRVNAEGRIETDANILAQRAAFLRPDSLVSIIMLTDENDCSIEPLPQNWVVAAISSQTSMFRGSSACDTNPNDPCCYPCVLNPPAGCTADATCSPAAGDAARLPDEADGRNLRCFDQKRRFGYDFLYPTERYVNALRGRNGFCWSDRGLTTNPDECVDGRGQRVGLTPNPLYEGGRDESSVFLAGIVGVPWQAISTDVDGNGRPLAANQLRFKPAPEFTPADWDAIAGRAGTADGAAPVPPTNPYMVETPLVRQNITAGNEINGRDYNTAQGQNMGVNDDLQYACIFPLPPGEQRDCSTAQQGANDCDCSPNENDKPLCQEQPGVSANTTTQYYAKAYPGLRELQVLRDYGDNSIVASICAKNVDDQNSPDFGYRPAIAAIVDRLKEKLGDRCLPRRLQPADDNTIPCSLVEVQLGVSACNCDNSIARFVPTAETASAIRSRLLEDDTQPCGSDTTCQQVCLCEVEQVTEPNELRACQEDVEASGIEGWCYIADTEDQEIGNPELVANCPATERRLLRFVGAGLRPNTVTYVSCQGSSFDPGVSEL